MSIPFLIREKKCYTLRSFFKLREKRKRGVKGSKSIIMMDAQYVKQTEKRLLQKREIPAINARDEL